MKRLFLAKQIRKKTVSMILCVSILLTALTAVAGIFISAESGKKMLYLKTSSSDNGDRRPLQQVKVEVGESYIYTFSMSTESAVEVICRSNYSDRPGVNGVELLESTPNGKSVDYTYRFTIPEKDNNGNSMTDTAFVGMQVAVGFEGYLFDFGFYKETDPEKKDLLTNGDFETGTLYGWNLGWNSLKNAGEEWSSGSTTLRVMPFDTSLNESKGAKMLYLKTSASADIADRRLLEQVAVNIGETYILEFTVNTGSTLEVIGRSDNSGRPGINGVTALNEIQKGSSTRYTYEFKVPEQDNNGNAMSKTIFVGMQVAQGFEGYLFDFAFYKKDDSQKNNLLVNGDFGTGTLYGWNLGWNSLKNEGNEWSNGNTTLKIMPFDTSLTEVKGSKMLYMNTSADSVPDDRRILEQIAVEVGESYIYTFTAYTTSNFEVICRSDAGGRPGIKGVELLKQIEKGKSTQYTYRFTIPEKDNNGNQMTATVFVGLQAAQGFDRRPCSL